MPNEFTEVEQQPLCSGDADDTSYIWTDDDPYTGLSFPLYQFLVNKEASCNPLVAITADCKAGCDRVGGQFDDDDGTCT